MQAPGELARDELWEVRRGDGMMRLLDVLACSCCLMRLHVWTIHVQGGPFDHTQQTLLRAEGSLLLTLLSV